ncbi:hypothetical protein Sango_2505900 [Sesamum angolense]|uniref:DUF3444 domain-containing protein n=1 Tax=Sesamum angolense TaxID=2727404 RepID=A0AAE1W475_9LAMI|nr:hypothetical protein Sango_2505900 [Sesamum angolense]
METNIEEALRVKALAEKQFATKDFIGAQNYALKAQMLCPELEGKSKLRNSIRSWQYCSTLIRIELLELMGHLDLSLKHGRGVKRSSYDQRRNLFAGYSTGAGGYDNCSKFSASHSTLDTFWTVCTSCHVQYEYLRKYVNKRLSCKNCRGVFVAVETGLAPVSGSFPYSTYSYAPENGYGSHGCGVAYIPKTTGYCAPTGPPGHHAGYRSEYASNISFEGTSSINSVGIVDPNGLSTSSFVFYQANEEANKAKANGTHNKAKGTRHMASNGYTGQDDIPKPRREAKIINVNGTLKPALSSPPETSTRRCSAVPAFDVRQVLIDKARSEIHRKLEEMRLASQVAAEEAEKRNTHAEVDKSKETVKVSGATGAGFQSELKRTASMSITVPDSDFHNFDQGRSEECFKPKQIWALYDEEDGMPRLYCIIREVISLNPFKIYISYLSSKSDCEFGSVNWLDSGFTKSCGSFRVFHSETVEQVNIFSHLLSREKAGRGGCVRIYPRGGDIWAVYRNWSPDWNRTTPDEVRHQYEMVEVLEDYSEENGVWVTPLIKLSGYKTVYQRNANTSAIRWIPRREMLRFSHQVPSCSLKVEGINLPEGCWDLDPAATPDELLQGETEPQNNISPGCAEKSTETPPNEQFSAEPKGESEEKLSQSQNFASTPVAVPQVEGEACPEKRKPVELFEGQERTQAELPQGDFTIKAAAELSRTEAIANI